MSQTGENSRRAFTLIEVLITVVILSTGIIVVLSAFSTSLFALGESRDCLWATMLIREKIVETKLAALEKGHVTPRFSNGGFPGLYRDFRWDVRTSLIGAFPQGPDSDAGRPETLHEVIVTVRREGSSRKYSATTYLRQNRQ